MTDTSNQARVPDVYQQVLDGFVVVAGDHPSENELGVAAFATHALLAPLPEDADRRARLHLLLEMMSDGVGEDAAKFREPGRSLFDQISAAPASGAARRLLHEGFLVAPLRESHDQVAELEQGAVGLMLWSTPEVWWRWGSKPMFRAACASLLGEQAVPPGRTLTVGSLAELDEAVADVLRDTATRVIVKLPGIGGQGNTIVTKRNSPRLASLWQHSAAAQHGVGADVVIESWLPWDSTHSLSYFMEPSRAPRTIALCRQRVDTQIGRFIGSTNEESLHARDADALRHHLAPVLASMTASGYRGVAGIDVIVGSAARWSGWGLPLPSGAVACLIECNPRFNRHNRVGLLIERLARRWDLPSGRLIWHLQDRQTTATGTGEFEAEIQAFLVPPRCGEQRQLRLVDRADRVMDLSVSLRAGERS